jgi:hypothetical protein
MGLMTEPLMFLSDPIVAFVDEHPRMLGR